MINRNRGTAWCVTNSKRVNTTKEYAGKGQNMPVAIDELTDIDLSEITTIMLTQSGDGMWEWAEINDLQHLQMLDDFGNLECLKQSYNNTIIYG